MVQRVNVLTVPSANYPLGIILKVDENNDNGNNTNAVSSNPFSGRSLLMNRLWKKLRSWICGMCFGEGIMGGALPYCLLTGLFFLLELLHNYPYFAHAIRRLRRDSSSQEVIVEEIPAGTAGVPQDQLIGQHGQVRVHLISRF